MIGDPCTIVRAFATARTPWAAVTRLARTAEGPLRIREPRAFLGRVLSHPLRRGLDVAELRSYLTLGGFDVVSSSEDASWVEVVAIPREDPIGLALARAFGREAGLEGATDDPIVAARLGLSALEREELARAAELLMTGVGDEDAVTLARVGLARCAAAFGELDTARALVRTTLATWPTSPWALVLSGALTDDATRLDMLAHANALEPSSVQIASELAQELVGRREHAHAEDVMARAASFGDDLPWAFEVAHAWLLVELSRWGDVRGKLAILASRGDRRREDVRALETALAHESRNQVFAGPAASAGAPVPNVST